MGGERFQLSYSSMKLYYTFHGLSVVLSRNTQDTRLQAPASTNPPLKYNFTCYALSHVNDILYCCIILIISSSTLQAVCGYYTRTYLTRHRYVAFGRKPTFLPSNVRDPHPHTKNSKYTRKTAYLLPKRIRRECCPGTFKQQTTLLDVVHAKSDRDAGRFTRLLLNNQKYKIGIDVIDATAAAMAVTVSRLSIYG